VSPASALPIRSPSANPLPIRLPPTPEPYPFSDRYPAQVSLASPADLQTLYRLGIDLDGVASGIATVYVSPAEAAALAGAGLVAIPIPNDGLRNFVAYGPGSDAPNAWPTYNQYVARMQALEAAHPNLVDLIQMGTTVQGRLMYCMKVTDNPALEENEPEFKYSSTMHGDETTGAELTMRLAELLATSYGSDPALTTLVDNLETWLCPISNPDGYVAGSRWNAHGEDLNRNFPDRFTDPVDDPAGREPETQAYMYLGYAHRFVMGANYHGGAQVLNYPWDAVAAPGDPIVPDYAPDDQLFYDFGTGYTIRNPMLWNGGFPEGVTRGWEWYQIWGGMQDWAYYWRGEHHVTIEVSNTKNPPFEQMDYYWDNNEEAMLWWLEQALSGLHGRVLDARDSAPLDTSVNISGLSDPVFARTDPDAGDYHRVISPGSYTLNVSVAGYLPQSANVTVVAGQPSVQDFYLCPQSPWTVSGTVTDLASGLPCGYPGVPWLPVIAQTDPGMASIRRRLPAIYTLRLRPTITPRSASSMSTRARSGFRPGSHAAARLSPSAKQVSAIQALPGDVLTYQVRLENSALPAAAALTDTLPAGVTWTGYLTATQGQPAYAGGQITWQGPLDFGQVVTVTYAVSVEQCLPAGTDITNLAAIYDGVATVLTRTASVTVENAAPGAPALLAPADGAAGQPLDAGLSWAASPDLNCDPITYDLYFGASNPPPLLAAALPGTTFSPGPLLAHTTYYWSVTASDGLAQAASPVWSFTTLNNLPLVPQPIAPADGAANVPLTTTLAWQSSDPDNDPLTYTLVYWAAGSPPLTVTLAAASFDPGPLLAHTSYGWQVTAEDGLAQVPSPAWSFTTLNNLPLAPQPISPADGALEVPLTTTLAWQSSDPDNDPLTSTLVYWAAGGQPITVTLPTASRPGLLAHTSYAWQVTPGTAWPSAALSGISSAEQCSARSRSALPMRATPLTASFSGRPPPRQRPLTYTWSIGLRAASRSPSR
jgi:carboxypeptidase D